MTWPFENDTVAIVKKLAKRSLASEKRRNLMAVIAVENLRQEILSVDGVTNVLVPRRSLHGKFRTSESAEAGMCDMEQMRAQAEIF